MRMLTLTSSLALLRAGLVAGIAVAAAACSSPTQPSGPPADMTCPTPQTVQSPLSTPISVTFPLPTVENSAANSSVTCSPASGSTFPLGTTSVNCQYAVGGATTLSCSFNVTVEAPPRMAFTQFVAFGDSITEGKVSEPVALSGSLTQWLGLMEPETRFAILESRLTASFETYPQRLQRLLGLQYQKQTFSVVNAGLGGEFAAGDPPSGILRLPGVLQTFNPEVLLLMEGTNDLLSPSGVNSALSALDAMIGIAQAQGRQVCLATIPPQRPDGLRNRGSVAARIPGFNDGIRALAASRGAVLVDVYDAMKDDVRNLIGIDDLHPTELGYSVIGDTFYNAVHTAFEQRGGGSSQPTQ
ncbi:MAG: GDSL-type esterase/lipase family protein [Vicinamibacterales bacterium]